MKKIILFSVFAGLAHAQAPAGYYNSANGLSGAALKTELSSIITNGHMDKGYSGLWTAYKTTDIDKTMKMTEPSLIFILKDQQVVILILILRDLISVERILLKEIVITESILFLKAYSIKLRQWLRIFTLSELQTGK